MIQFNMPWKFGFPLRCNVSCTGILKLDWIKSWPLFVLNLFVSYFIFCFHLFHCISYSFYLLFSFFLKGFVALKDSISLLLILKRTSLCEYICTRNAYKIKKFLPFSLQPIELYYISVLFLCWRENSCSLSLHIIALF